jgi:purine-binding chemotaxis protein CheW
MTTTLDKKMLDGFTREVHSYLPQVRASIDSLQTNTPQGEVLEEAVQYVHTIKGAAAMLGLSALSHMTSYIEETLAETVTGKGQWDAACNIWLHYALDKLEQYLESLLVDDGGHQAIVTDVVQAFRRFKSLPAADDAVVVAAILAEEAAPLCKQEPGDEASETPAPLRHNTETVPGDTLDALSTTIDDAVCQADDQGAASPAHREAGGRADQVGRYVLFTLAGSRYAVSVPHVLEISRVPPVTPVPNVPTWVHGIVNVRGDILSVIDVRTFLGCEEAPQGEENRMLVVKARGDEIMTSLVVDQVMGIVPLCTTHVDASTVPTPGNAMPYLNGVCEYGNQVVAVFDLERFLLSPEVRQFE